MIFKCDDLGHLYYRIGPLRVHLQANYTEFEILGYLVMVELIMPELRVEKGYRGDLYVFANLGLPLLSIEICKQENEDYWEQYE